MAATYILGPFRLDAETDTLFRGGEPVSLGRRAVALLRVLVEQRGIPVSKDALMEAAWAGLTVEESNLAVQIAALRRVFGEEPGGANWIETLPRRGYRFVGPASIRHRACLAGGGSRTLHRASNDRPHRLRSLPARSCNGLVVGTTTPGSARSAGAGDRARCALWARSRLGRVLLLPAAA